VLADVCLLVRICNPYTNSSVLIKISIFSTHPLGQGNKCRKWVLKTAKRVCIFAAGWHIRLSGREVLNLLQINVLNQSLGQSKCGAAREMKEKIPDFSSGWLAKRDILNNKQCKWE
jgi:hypothetical protein